MAKVGVVVVMKVMLKAGQRYSSVVVLRRRGQDGRGRRGRRGIGDLLLRGGRRRTHRRAKSLVSEQSLFTL